ncbi:MAG: proline iminopeptidase-family hydrolase, partial [Rhizobiales bacterium]|nr:proline iminopeptidase-family hydrolase [Hyphomicrobiales bacterium]
MAYRQADETRRVKVDGYEVQTYSFGTGDEVLFCLNGGPGLPCDYVRDAHSVLADHGYRVVCFDQLGCGRSDRPDDDGLWTLARYVEEVETVRTALGLGRVHLLGQSWGTWLGIEYALTHNDAIKTITLADGAANIPHLITELERLRAALGPETVAMMQRHEADGTTDHPEYLGAITVLNYRHVCRLQEWPEAVRASLDDWNMAPYRAIQGPNEFSAQAQIPVIDALLAQKPDAIAIAVADPNALIPPLQKWADEGIPIVTFDSALADPPFPVVSQIGSG